MDMSAHDMRCELVVATTSYGLELYQVLAYLTSIYTFGMQIALSVELLTYELLGVAI